MLLEIAQLVLNGLGMGLVFVLLAVGFNLILSVPRVLFIAYGEFYMLGAYVFWAMLYLWGMPFLVCLIAAALLPAVLSAVGYRAVFQRIQGRGRRFLTNVVAAIGMMMVLRQAAVLLFGTADRGLPEVFAGIISFAGLTISTGKAVLITLSLVVAFVVYFILQKTNIGRGMRAVALSADVASLQGINANKMYLMTMALGCAISGFAGGIMTPVFHISPWMGTIILPVLFIVTLGGVGSMLGSVIGGLIFGIVTSFGDYYISSGVSQIGLYGVIGIIIFFKPGGLFGHEEEMGL
jgi:branched-chain amino acid transport system permease protein